MVNAEGFGDQARVSATSALLEQLSGKAGRPARPAQEAGLRWMDAVPVLESNAAAWRPAEGGARLLLTEDRPGGFSWRGVRVVNPLAAPADPLLVPLLG
jgi:hypothetical protein